MGCPPPFSDQWASTGPSTVLSVAHIHLGTSIRREEAQNERGCTRGHQLFWGSLSPKTLCPRSRLEKWGFRANPLGLMSHRSRQERRKIPRLRRQDWAGGQRKLGEEAARPTARICSNHGPPEQLDRAVCVLSRAQVACHTHLNRLPQAWAHLSWDPHEPGRRISHAAGTRRPRSWLHAALDPHRPLGLRVPCPPFGSFMCSHWVPPAPYPILSGMTLSGLEGTGKILKLEEEVKTQPGKVHDPGQARAACHPPRPARTP